MNDYMTFEETMEFLSTPRSTLYRWLREGRVPGHKIGRQWRFLRDELEAVVQTNNGHPSVSLTTLAELLRARGGPMEIENSNTPTVIAENLIWDAMNRGARVVHLTPAGDGHDVVYRTENGLEPLIHLPHDAFDALDDVWSTSGSRGGDSESRRIFMSRGEAEDAERVHVKIQRLETLGGPRITLRLIKESRVPIDFERIADAEDAATLKRWTEKPHGLVLISGRSGSGKTTTAYVCLNALAAAGDKVIFTIEQEVGSYLSGVNQVEVNLDDEAAYREAFSAIFASDLDVLFIASTFAQRHRSTLWGTALSAAESGHLVFVQLEADSAEDALEKFQSAVDRPIAQHVVGSVWQELRAKKTGGREAVYDVVTGLRGGK